LRIARRKLDVNLRAKGDPWDLVQETFLEASRDFRRFLGTSEAELRGWLCRMLLHNLSDFRRRYLDAGKRRAACESTLGDAGEALDPMDQVLADVSSPGEQVIAHEQAEALRRALERLPAHFRQVICLRNEEGLPFNDIGPAMGRSANAVEKLWLRAVERLREDLRVTAE
jgi:RNA polymerase sigma-70 factor (ECF subfamily)